MYSINNYYVDQVMYLRVALVAGSCFKIDPRRDNLVRDVKSMQSCCLFNLLSVSEHGTLVL